MQTAQTVQRNTKSVSRENVSHENVENVERSPKDAIWTLNKSAMPFVPKHPEEASDTHGALKGDKGDATSFYDHTFSDEADDEDAVADDDEDEQAETNVTEDEISPSSFVRDMASVFAAESTETKSADVFAAEAEENVDADAGVEVGAPVLHSYYVPDGILSSPSPPASVFEVDLQSLGYNLSGARAWFADEADDQGKGKGGAGFSQLY